MGLGSRQWLFYFFRVELELGVEWRKGGRHWGLSHMALPVIIITLLIILIISGMTFASSDQKQKAKYSFKSGRPAICLSPLQQFQNWW